MTISWVHNRVLRQDHCSIQSDLPPPSQTLAKSNRKDPCKTEGQSGDSYMAEKDRSLQTVKQSKTDYRNIVKYFTTSLPLTLPFVPTEWHVDQQSPSDKHNVKPEPRNRAMNNNITHNRSSPTPTAWDPSYSNFVNRMLAFLYCKRKSRGPSRWFWVIHISYFEPCVWEVNGNGICSLIFNIFIKLFNLKWFYMQ